MSRCNCTPASHLTHDIYSEVFVADRGCLLAALDLRNGRTIYSYKGALAAIFSAFRC